MRAQPALLLLIVAACSGTPAATTPADTSIATTAPAAVTTLAPSTTSTSTTSTSTTTTVAATSTTTTTLPETLNWLTINTFGEQQFGEASVEDVVAYVATVFGPPADDSVNEECGAGPSRIIRWGDFSLLFQSDVLQGWFYESSVPQLATPSGVTTGLTLEEIYATYGESGVNLFEDSLGWEFIYEVTSSDWPNFIAGFADGGATDASVTALYAGTTCFFR